jgi:predicted NBD/HSP70 family sugar kinase
VNQRRAHTPPAGATGAEDSRRRGSNQVGLGRFNERIVLHAIRLHGATPKAELARLTELSSQTVSLIINRLLADGLVVKHGRVRGRIGQPSVPIALNPDGAFSIGVKIGRRSLDVLLVDFTGRVRDRSMLNYTYPDPDQVFDQIGARIERLRASLAPAQRARVVGVGIAAPLSLGGWSALLGIEPERAQRWNQTDIRRRLLDMTGLPVEFAKDTAAACVAELVAGRGQAVDSFLYLFVDTFIGGGLVIDGQPRLGGRGNAGAVASLPLRVSSPRSARSARPSAALSPGSSSSGTASADSEPRDTPEQLVSAASLWALERLYQRAGLDPAAVADHRALLPPWLDQTNAWLSSAAPAIALALVSAVALIDLDAVIVDGSCDPSLLARLLADVAAVLPEYEWEGLQAPLLIAGTHGSDARALGGALLPIYTRFAPDHDVFFGRAA